MKLAPLLVALCMSAPLALEAGSITAAERAPSPAPLAAVSEAEGTPASGRHPSAQPAHVQGQTKGTPAQNTRSATAPRPGGAFARGTDRLHPLLAKPRGRVSRPSSHLGSPRSAAPSGVAVPGPRMGHGVGQSFTAVSTAAIRAPSSLNAAARASTSLHAAARTSTIGGPLVTRRGPLGAPDVGRTTRDSALDGTQLHRKF